MALRATLRDESRRIFRPSSVILIERSESNPLHLFFGMLTFNSAKKNTSNHGDLPSRELPSGLGACAAGGRPRTDNQRPNPQMQSSLP
jgi:hypothetical protein